MDIIFSIISVLGSTASLLFTIWFLIVFGKEQYKKSIKFLIFAIFSILLAVYFNTSSVEMYGRAVYFAGGTLMIVAGIFILLLFEGKWKVALATIAISLLFVFYVSNFFGMKIVSSSSRYDYDYDNDNYYDDYDYDNDGNINQKEWEDALGDYMDDIMD